ncbi:MAG: alternative ribosome rescue aminoacyl-tRNA hydrolase ArfB [Desulfobulbaceae bacterium]|nr:alternative ribosome rescue aminoacyl-tRNA hydrolase ArfB [Desulfobulbaceae bacterium]
MALTVAAGGIVIGMDELHFDCIRASGPGGQHVNKTATAVQLRFDVGGSPSLPEAVRQRLLRLAGNRLTLDGVLIIEARRFRSQEQNRRDAVARLLDLVARAALAPKLRRPTKPGLGARKRRLDAKKVRGKIKNGRRSVAPGDE